TKTNIITRVLNPRYYNKNSFTFEHNHEEGTPIETREILLKSSVNLEGTDLFDFDGKMYYYGIKPDEDYNLQPVANNVKISVVAEKYSFEDVKRYQIPTLPYGETLALGLVINHDDGTHSK